MIVGREYFELSTAKEDLEVFFNVKRYFDGRHTVADIHRITGVNEADILDIVRTFSDASLFRSVRPLESIPTSVFVQQIEDSCDMWGKQIGYHPLFTGLATQQLRREVFLGMLLETYHYIKSASLHIGTAIAHCNDPAFEHILAEYHSEEWNHAHFALDTLVRMGMPKEQVLTAHPIIGTWSLINNLCDIARQDTLSYLACTTLFEAREQDAEGAAKDMRQLAVAYGYPEDAADPLIQHMELDVAADHKSLLAEALESRESVTAAEAHRVVNNLHDLKHSYDQFHDGIVQYYSEISNYIPRLTVDYFSL
jgi:pyrroloquinoline quinone (PQQ) biosynthesis protein C